MKDLEKTRQNARAIADAAVLHAHPERAEIIHIRLPEGKHHGHLRGHVSSDGSIWFDARTPSGDTSGVLVNGVIYEPSDRVSRRPEGHSYGPHNAYRHDTRITRLGGWTTDDVTPAARTFIDFLTEALYDRVMAQYPTAPLVSAVKTAEYAAKSALDELHRAQAKYAEAQQALAEAQDAYNNAQCADAPF